ncbi:MAG: alpha/beta hydrolase [Pseudomonadota bacterium]
MANLYSTLSSGGDDLLVLLHGMGTTADVWNPMIASVPREWGGRILALDLPGHGASPALEHYQMPLVAQSVAAAIATAQRAKGRLWILGHSYGGVVALALADEANGLHNGAPDHVFALGVKSVWSEQELEVMHALAKKTPKAFASQQDARERYLKVSGLAALGETGASCGARGIAEVSPGRWQLAHDPAANAITPPDLPALTASLSDRFSLAYGEDDRFVSPQDLAATDPGVRAIAGGGHNVMVNNPGAVWSWLALEER